MTERQRFRGKSGLFWRVSPVQVRRQIQLRAVAEFVDEVELRLGVQIIMKIDVELSCRQNADAFIAILLQDCVR
jgi:hypothetical protein